MLPLDAAALCAVGIGVGIRSRQFVCRQICYQKGCPWMQTTCVWGQSEAQSQFDYNYFDELLNVNSRDAKKGFVQRRNLIATTAGPHTVCMQHLVLPAGIH